MTDWIFQTWPLLLALAPFVLLAVTGATAVPPRRLAEACVVAAIPIYAGMSSWDIQDGHGAAALLWPVRVWNDFIGAHDYLALVKAAKTIRPDVPVRIGEHWYRFARPGVANAWLANGRCPDRIVFLQLDLPADDLDLAEMRISRDRVQLNIRTDSAQPRDSLLPSSRDVAITDRDLLVYAVAPRDRDIDRDAVRRKLKRFIENARVEPPAGTLRQ